MVNNRRIIRVGSRRSQLALVQTNIAINCLKYRNPALQFEVVQVSTVGDKILDVALSKIGEKSLFTKELENALLDGTVDFVVHSLKDVPSAIPHGLVLGCVFDRCSPEDVVLMSPSRRGQVLSDLPEGAIVGTSAVRRVATLSRLYPHLRFVSIRGNLNTRLKKLDEGHSCLAESNDSFSSQNTVKYDALVLAKAGIERLGWSHRIDQVLSDCFHAVSQGALACECRKDDSFVLSLLSDLHNEHAALSSIAERSLMHFLDGGCSTPIGVRYRLTPIDGHPHTLQLRASVLTADGSRCVKSVVITELPICPPQTYNNSDTLDNRDEIRPSTEQVTCGNLNSFSQHYTDELVVLNSQLSQDEVDLANDPSATFLGIHVNPSCTVARLRMARAVLLGKTLASVLLQSGAAEILDEIRQSVKSQELS